MRPKSVLEFNFLRIVFEFLFLNSSETHCQLAQLVKHIRQHWPRVQLKSDRLNDEVNLSKLFNRAETVFTNQNTVFKPRLLLSSSVTDNGQNHLAKALLDLLDHFKTRIIE